MFLYKKNAKNIQICHFITKEAYKYSKKIRHPRECRIIHTYKKEGNRLGHPLLKGVDK